MYKNQDKTHDRTYDIAYDHQEEYPSKNSYLNQL